MSFSGNSSTAPGLTLKKFESQTEVDEKKQKRQEEWEKVRKADDPEEFPEAPVDNRCLYDKLEEQRVKKQEEIEEKSAFRNQVRRLDADETNFLDFCTERQHEIHDERKQEEQKILTEMRDARVVKLEEAAKAEPKKARSSQTQASKKSQLSLLAGAVKRKTSSDDTSPSKKPKSEDPAETNDKQSTSTDAACRTSPPVSSTNNTKNNLSRVVAVLPVALPGLTEYADSSDSISSSSDDDVDFTLQPRGRIITIRHKASD